MKIDLFSKIPPRIRGWLYTLIGTIITIESVLDGTGDGLIQARTQGIGMAILVSLGFTMAYSNTPTPETAAGDDRGESGILIVLIVAVAVLITLALVGKL